VCCAFAYCWWREAGEVRARLAAEPARKKMDRPPMRCCWPRLLRAVPAWLTFLITISVGWTPRCAACGLQFPVTTLRGIGYHFYDEIDVGQ
jgi:hypothetical protein